MHKQSALSLIALVMLWLTPDSAQAIRPFVTDDARVVGRKLAQLEMWALVDRLVIEHNALAAVGPTDWLELTAGLIQGGVHTGGERGYSVTGPVLQAKALLLPASNNRWPGIAIAGGALAPWGHGPFVPPGWSGFGYVALTESLWDEWLLVHTNLGLAMGDDGDGVSTPGSEERERVRRVITGGLGVQARIIAGLHGMGEIYYGDPYDARFSHPAMQLGFRYIFSEHVQADGTFGSTLRAAASPDGHVRTEQWGTLGLRLVSSELW